MSNIIIRPGDSNDSSQVLEVLRESIRDLVQRVTAELPPSPTLSPAEAAGWQRLQPMLDFLAGHHYRWYVAEQDGRLIGHARSILLGDVLELTEFFVRPGAQSAGVGRDLLVRVFPTSGPDFKRRLIDATIDVRAQARYIKAGMTPRCPIYNLMSTNKVGDDVPTIPTDLSIEPAGDIDTALPLILAIDHVVLGLPRPHEHRWLLSDRDGYLYRRGGQVVGYGYIGRSERGYDGPFAVLDSHDFPAVLNHWERVALKRGGSFGLEVPTIATEALHYLVGRGYHIEQFITVLMTDQPIGDFSRYLLTSPPFFV